jgi:hypothetical protein
LGVSYSSRVFGFVGSVGAGSLPMTSSQKNWRIGSIDFSYFSGELKSTLANRAARVASLSLRQTFWVKAKVLGSR